MTKRHIKITITKEDEGYSASTRLGEIFIGTQAEDFEVLKSNIIEAINLAFEEDNILYTLRDLSFEYDLTSFFRFYRVINVKALAERIGMNQSLLSQYINGLKKPSKAQTDRILRGVQQIGKELTETDILV